MERDLEIKKKESRDRGERRTTGKKGPAMTEKGGKIRYGEGGDGEGSI
jgi:hypothetical protein